MPAITVRGTLFSTRRRNWNLLPLRAPPISRKISAMLIEADTTGRSAIVIDLAAYRSRRARRAGASSAMPATRNVMWVPMMMMVLVPVPIAGAERTDAG